MCIGSVSVSVRYKCSVCLQCVCGVCIMFMVCLFVCVWCLLHV